MKYAINCEHKDREHKALGLCFNCYTTFTVRNNPLRLLAKRGSALSWKDRNREIVNKSERVRHSLLKKEVLTHYSPNGVLGCSCSGCPTEPMVEFLTIDHINGRGENYISGSVLYRWLRSNGFPEGFQTLCYNCNCAKRDKGKCPHQIQIV